MHTEPQPGASTWRDRVNRLADSTDGSTHEDGIGLVQRVDRVAAFGPAILAVRWAIAIASIALATQQFEAKPYSMAVWSGMILAYTVVRTLHPLRYTGDVRSLLEVIGEVVLNVACVVATGYWDSPFILMMLTAVMVAGFARGLRVRPAHRGRLDPRRQSPVPHPGPVEDQDHPVGPVDPGAAARRPHRRLHPPDLRRGRPPAHPGPRPPGTPRRRERPALQPAPGHPDPPGLARPRRRAGHHRHPAPGALRLRHRRRCSASTTPTAPGSSCAARAAAGSPSARPSTTSPCRCAGSCTTRASSRVEDRNLPAAGWPASAPLGIGHGYAALRCRGSVIGMPPIEHADDNHLHRPHVELLEASGRAGRPAIDNARWSPGCGPSGAYEERTRTARDLDDRIGELPRLHGLRARQHRRQGSLVARRWSVPPAPPRRCPRRTASVRDTLYDRRTDASDAHEIADTSTPTWPASAERSSLADRVFCDPRRCLPPLEEREMWRHRRGGARPTSSATRVADPCGAVALQR